jgi:hypothetical protein
MTNSTIEKLIWPLIFGGLFGAGFGLMLGNEGSSLAWPVTALGCAAVAVGAVLIWMRSRRP